MFFRFAAYDRNQAFIGWAWKKYYYDQRKRFDSLITLHKY